MKSGLHIAKWGTAVLGLAALATIVVVRAEEQNFRSQLRDVADNAALAGVSKVAADQDRKDCDASQRAVEAARSALSSLADGSERIDVSEEGRKVTVTISVPKPERFWAIFWPTTIGVTRTAHYVPPQQGAGPTEDTQHPPTTQGRRVDAEQSDCSTFT